MENVASIVSKASKELEHNPRKEYTRKRPTQECEGYQSPPLPSHISNDDIIDFYVSSSSNEKNIACTLYRSSGPHNVYVENLGLRINASKPVIVICHGFMSWRNQMLLAHLAGGLTSEMNCHTLRFDFTGNGHSSGTFRLSNYDGEYLDLKAIVSFIQEKMKCLVPCILGHSKGAACVLRYATEQEKERHALRIPCFVNLSGRYFTPFTYDVSRILNEDQISELRTCGKTIVDKKGSREFVVTMDDIQEINSLNSDYVLQIRSSRVMTLHGSKDTQVDLSNAYQFENKIRNHKLVVIDGGDHNYNGLRHIRRLVDSISSFIASVESDG
jgi:uncharacterized protein